MAEPASSAPAAPPARPSKEGSATSDWALERDQLGELWLQRGGTRQRVVAIPCFPWTAPEQWITLRAEDGEELALIASADELEAGSRRALRSALGEHRFVFEIVDIIDIREHFELRHWSVRTRQGPRQFQTALDYWPAQSGNGLSIRDVAGDLYWIPEPATLPGPAHRRLWPFLD